MPSREEREEDIREMRSGTQESSVISKRNTLNRYKQK